MKSKVRYKDFRIGSDAYTVKLRYLPRGGFYYNPVVRVQVMKWHLWPHNLRERITEWWKYDIADYEWDPTLTETSLEDYCIDKCHHETAKRIAIKRCSKEWLFI